MTVWTRRSVGIQDGYPGLFTQRVQFTITSQGNRQDFLWPVFYTMHVIEDMASARGQVSKYTGTSTVNQPLTEYGWIAQAFISEQSAGFAVPACQAGSSPGPRDPQSLTDNGTAGRRMDSYCLSEPRQNSQMKQKLFWRQTLIKHTLLKCEKKKKEKENPKPLTPKFL